MDKDITHRIEMLLARVAALRQCSPAAAPTALSHALDQLDDALEELRTKNEELVMAGAAIESERQHYRELFETAPDGYLVTDALGTIRDANRAAAQLFNTDQRFLIGVPLAMLVVEQERRTFKSTLGRLRERATTAEGITDSLATRLWRRDAPPFEAAMTVAMASHPSHPEAALRWLVRDCTPQKEIEAHIRHLNAELEQRIEERTAQVEAANRVTDDLLAAEQRARAAAEAAGRLKDEFLATLSHELRTPLNVILGLAWRLRTGRMNADASARALETIERNARIQVRLIENLLEVSRIITGKLKLDPKPVKLSPIIATAIDAIRSAALAKGVTLVLPAEPIEETVQGDPSRLQQVIWNLLSNAVKFTPPGGLVYVSSDTAGDRARITVADTGVGITSEFLPHVFERFRQADSDSVRPSGGIGLGLAMVRHLVELHGGEVHAESRGEGEGAVFTIYLPLAAHGPAESDRRQQAASGETQPTPALNGVRVLLAEEDDENRRWIARLLERLGATVTTVGSVPEALDEVTHTRPDVLLSDLRIQGGDGYALIRKVRALDAARGMLLPAAAITAYGRSEDRVQAFLAGFQIYLRKPVDSLELGAAVATLAGRASQSTRKRQSSP